MIQPMTKLALVSLFILTIVYFVVFLVWKKRHSSFGTLGINAFINALTLNSAFILLAYTSGKIFGITFFANIDDYALYSALIFAAFIIIVNALDDLEIKTPYTKEVTENKPKYEPQIEEYKND